ncbi:hypothetical protein ACTGZO_09310 [Streptococcus suis]
MFNSEKSFPETFVVSELLVLVELLALVDEELLDGELLVLICPILVLLVQAPKNMADRSKMDKLLPNFLIARPPTHGEW